MSSIGQCNWNSTSSSVDPWSITSKDVHVSKQPFPYSVLLKDPNTTTKWSSEWNTSPNVTVSKIKSNSISRQSQRPFVSKNSEQYYHLETGQSWDMASDKYSQPTQKKSLQFMTHIEEELSHQDRYKTELCRSWTENGTCRYGRKCQFAHGEEELRPILRHPKYKTELCRSWSESGTCPYGNRCRFIHNENEAQLNNVSTQHVNSYDLDQKLKKSKDDSGSVIKSLSRLSLNSPPSSSFIMSQTQKEMLIGLEDLQTDRELHSDSRLEDFQKDDDDDDDEDIISKSRLKFFQDLCL